MTGAGSVLKGDFWPSNPALLCSLLGRQILAPPCLAAHNSAPGCRRFPAQSLPLPFRNRQARHTPQIGCSSSWLLSGVEAFRKVKELWKQVIGQVKYFE